MWSYILLTHEEQVSSGHKKIWTLLTASQWPHLSVLCVDLADVSHAFTQHVHRDLVAVLIHPVSCFIPSPLYLRPAVSYG